MKHLYPIDPAHLAAIAAEPHGLPIAVALWGGGTAELLRVEGAIARCSVAGHAFGTWTAGVGPFPASDLRWDLRRVDHRARAAWRFTRDAGRRRELRNALADLRDAHLGVIFDSHGPEPASESLAFYALNSACADLQAMARGEKLPIDRARKALEWAAGMTS